MRQIQRKFYFSRIRRYFTLQSQTHTYYALKKNKHSSGMQITIPVLEQSEVNLHLDCRNEIKYF